ncbi:MAG: DUF3999 family protein [Rhodoferax sp.]|nr:DUF3999 family protein [Rhodoferax sp.]
MLSANASAANAPTPTDFAWRATLAVPAGANAARITLPAEAMVRLQSRNAHDVRVFNADGEAVAFALVPSSGTTSSPTVQTQRYAALALFNATSGKRPGKNSVQVQIDQNGQRGSVWVRFGDGANGAASSEPTSSRLPTVLFDTRTDKQTIDALTLQAEFPANTLVHFSLASSTDLVRWTPIALKGPLFRFDGADAPSSTDPGAATTPGAGGPLLAFELGWPGRRASAAHAGSRCDHLDTACTGARPFGRRGG